jgi:hypothetical protein
MGLPWLSVTKALSAVICAVAEKVKHKKRKESKIGLKSFIKGSFAKLQKSL